jgi:hypothetical protein
VTTRTWLRNLFAARTPRTVRKAPARRQLHVELLEDRRVPANLTVSTLADNLVADGQLTLREAVLLVNNGGNTTAALGRSLSSGEAGAVNATTPFGTNDSITLVGSGQITLTGSQLDLTRSVRITGPSAGQLSVSGGFLSRVFAVGAGATVTLSRLGIREGSVPVHGGGIFNNGTLTVQHCTIFGSHSTFGDGGGIFNNGTLTVQHCTIFGNSAANGGGIQNSATLTVQNSTISGNRASAFAGGGLNNHASATVEYSTIAANHAAGTGGGIYNGGVDNNKNFLPAPMFLNSSIVAGNTSSLRGANRYSDDILQFASVESSHSLIGVVRVALLGDEGPRHGVKGNLVGTEAAPLNPLLGPLQNNGGPTPTHALQAGSPARNAGAVAQIPAGITTDQRGMGFARISGAGPDMGAFEYSNVAPTITALNVQATGVVGITVAVSATATDPETAQDQLRYSWTITFPDGTTASRTGAAFTPTPTYPGNFSFRVTVTDGDGTSVSRTATMTVYSRAASEKFVQALYKAEVGRTGSAAEVASWVNVLGGSGGQAAVVAGIVNSTEARARVVTGWYQTYLGRSPSATEVSAQVTALASQTEEQVLSGILGSTEFFSRAQSLGFNGTADQKYVQALYQALLGRVPSSTELASQVGALQQVGRPALALSILKSTEYRANVVRGYFTDLLHRTGTQAEVASWVNTNFDLRAIRMGIESSLEFFFNG